MDESIALIEFSKLSRRFRRNPFNYAHIDVGLNIDFHAGHDAWDREYKSQKRRKTAYAYTKFPWAPPPRQPDYAYMTGHAPDRLAWLANASLIEWMLDVDCDACAGAAPYSEALLAIDEVVVEPPAVAGPATQLHGAVKFGTLEDVRALVDAGADLGARDAGDKERTPLHVACHLARDDVVRLLVDRGADLDAREVRGWRPLHEVAHAGGLATARYLLDAGADLDARADGGWHALHQASGNGHPDLVRLFLDAGARADARAENTMEPIHAALQMAKPKVAALLIPALDGVVDLRGYTVGEQGILALAAALGTVWKSNLQPDFNVRVIERIAPNSFAVLRELDESNRSVQKSAESTSI